MVSFNECEYWTSEYLSEMLPENIAKLLNEESLQKRCRAVRAAIRDANLNVLISEVDGLFNQLNDLATYRNLLAHNAPMVCIYESISNNKELDSNLHVAIELKTQKGKMTDLVEIQGMTIRANRLSADMLTMFEKIIDLRKTSAM